MAPEQAVCAWVRSQRGNSRGGSPALPKCSSLEAVGILAAGISKASQRTGTGYTLGLNGNALKAVGVGVDLAGSVALVSDPCGNVGIARSLSVTPSVGARSYGRVAHRLLFVLVKARAEYIIRVIFRGRKKG